MTAITSGWLIAGWIRFLKLIQLQVRWLNHLMHLVPIRKAWPGMESISGMWIQLKSWFTALTRKPEEFLRLWNLTVISRVIWPGTATICG